MAQSCGWGVVISKDYYFLAGFVLQIEEFDRTRDAGRDPVSWILQALNEGFRIGLGVGHRVFLSNQITGDS